MAHTTYLALFLVCLVSLFSAGCRDGGPELGTVSGTVRLDGEPVPKATIVFQPGAGGSPSEGRTDENGYYELLYGVDKPGAMLGEHVVQISTYRQYRDDDEGPVLTAPELLPPKYNEESTLKRHVKSGSQTIDFDLKSR